MTRLEFFDKIKELAEAYMSEGNDRSILFLLGEGADSSGAAEGTPMQIMTHLSVMFRKMPAVKRCAEVAIKGPFLFNNYEKSNYDKDAN